MYFIGVDLGKSQDHTAIVVVEKEDPGLLNQSRLYAALRPLPPSLLVRRLERVALGTSYPRIVEHLRAITQEPALAGRCTLVVDATGLGEPVVDMLRESGAGCDITAVTITGGNGISRRGHMHFGVPRRDLLAGLQLAFEQGRLRIARNMKYAEAFGRELLAMRAGRPGSEHDDLVFAVSLACWRANRKSVWGTSRLPGI